MHGLCVITVHAVNKISMHYSNFLLYDFKMFEHFGFVLTNTLQTAQI